MGGILILPVVVGLLPWPHGSSGPCSFLVLFMVLRPLFGRLPACANCGPLFIRSFGLVVGLWLVWVWFSADPCLLRGLVSVSYVLDVS